MNRTDGTWNYRAVTWDEVKRDEALIRDHKGGWYVSSSSFGSPFIQPYIRTKEAVPLELWEALHPDNRGRAEGSGYGGETWFRPEWDAPAGNYGGWLFRLPPIGATKSVTATDEQWEQIKALGVEVSE